MKASSSPFRSDFYMWNGVSAIFFSNCLTNSHSHNTMQIVLDIQDKFRCRIGNEDWQTFKNLIIRENCLHQLDTAGSVQIIVYLDTETTLAKEIKSKCLIEKDYHAPELNLFDHIKPNLLQQALLQPNAALLLSIIQEALSAIAGIRLPKKSDQRITDIEHFLATAHPAEISIRALAEKVYLSESRLRSLFRQQTGVSLYKYILWSRIRFAINRVMAGSPINDAAWEAGFADNSHFCKILVSMFGISPSQFIRDNKKMDILTCDQSPLVFETKVYDEQGQVEKIYR
jgi:AraC-like DNA-binding protein